jgi:hypothetical protein
MESANEDKAVIDPINLTPRERDVKLRLDLEHLFERVDQLVSVASDIRSNK